MSGTGDGEQVPRPHLFGALSDALRRSNLAIVRLCEAAAAKHCITARGAVTKIDKGPLNSTRVPGINPD